MADLTQLLTVRALGGFGTWWRDCAGTLSTRCAALRGERETGERSGLDPFAGGRPDRQSAIRQLPSTSFRNASSSFVLPPQSSLKKRHLAVIRSTVFTTSSLELQ